MLHNLHLRPDGRYRKSAAVVGEVMAKYHPHGDQSIYDAMVRMAQSFSLLHPLVDGQGNFGSLDGDPPAAMRYTEAKLRPLALELLDELGRQTVDFRPNYDGQSFEPCVLPARFPNLLVNGSEGIAVGMATRIPPHNLKEILDACVLLLDKPDSDLDAVLRRVRGPDFPTGGEILNSPDELRTLYETGQGAVLLRGSWVSEKVGRKNQVIITSVPFAQNKAQLVERIGQLIMDKALPQLLDVRDESTDEVRIALELRRPEDEGPAMAYLCKHTPLQQRYHVNLTALIPQPDSDVGTPARLDLVSALRIWLDWRIATLRRRFEYDLARLREQIHLLEGFAIIFGSLDEAIAIIRKSEGKRDAAEKLMNRFDLDDEQADAILETKLYKLAKLEIKSILEELAAKRAEAAKIEAILGSAEKLRGVLREELQLLAKTYGTKRRSSILGAVEQERYSEDAYIVAEDTFVILTRDGWIKRQSSFTDLSKIRLREGDNIGWLVKASTRATVTVFTDKGGAYTLRVDGVPATSGHGDPITRHFRLEDGERVVGLASHDPRTRPVPSPKVVTPEGEVPPPHIVAVTRFGRGVRAALDSVAEPSSRTGRRYCKVDDAGDGVVAVWPSAGDEQVSLASVRGHMLTFPVSELPTVRGPGKGITAMKLNEGDQVFGFELSTRKDQGVVVRTPQGREEIARPSKYEGHRGDKGSVVLRRDSFADWMRMPHVVLGTEGDKTP